MRKQTLVDVLLERTLRRRASCGLNTESGVQLQDKLGTSTSSSIVNDHIDVEANGTPESIHVWALESFPNDYEQQRAFEILAAKFVLHYFWKLMNLMMATTLFVVDQDNIMFDTENCCNAWWANHQKLVN